MGENPPEPSIATTSGNPVQMQSTRHKCRTSCSGDAFKSLRVNKPAQMGSWPGSWPTSDSQMFLSLEIEFFPFAAFSRHLVCNAKIPLCLSVVRSKATPKKKTNIRLPVAVPWITNAIISWHDFPSPPFPNS